jgi:hypothetical protein
MVDTNFIAAFANNPITLTILIIGTIIVVIIWKVSPFFKDLLEKMDTGNETVQDQLKKVIESDEQQSKDIQDIKQHVRFNTLDILRMTIYNEQVDLKDRLVAAKRYFMRDGNGKVATYVSNLIAQNPVIWDTILAMCTPDDQAKLTKALEAE